MEELVQKYIQRVERAIDHGLDHERFKKTGQLPKSKLTDDVFDLKGMSTNEVRMFLNEMVHPDTRYLEIGVHRGSTFISALYKNQFEFACAIDEFDPPYSNDDIVKDFLMKCKKNRIGNFSVIRNDSFNLKPEQSEALKNINTYFYDGGHYEWQHEKVLTYYYKNLANVFIFIVDDWAHEPAVKGTRKALKDLNFKIHKEWELGYSHTIKNREDLGWHNGLYIAVLEK